VLPGAVVSRYSHPLPPCQLPVRTGTAPQGGDHQLQWCPVIPTPRIHAHLRSLRIAFATSRSPAWQAGKGYNHETSTRFGYHDSRDLSSAAPSPAHRCFSRTASSAGPQWTRTRQIVALYGVRTSADCAPNAICSICFESSTQ